MTDTTQSTTRHFLNSRTGAISNDLANVFAGSEMAFDESAVRIAETLVAYADLVLEWAAMPGTHGGNPYGHEFVKVAQEIRGVK